MSDPRARQDGKRTGAGTDADTAADDGGEARKSAGREAAIEVILPAPLGRLAGIGNTVKLNLSPPFTQRRVLDALEQRYPALAGTTRHRENGRRRAYLRFFACGEDWSDRNPDDPLPAAVAEGREPYLIVGAMSGG